MDRLFLPNSFVYILVGYYGSLVRLFHEILTGLGMHGLVTRLSLSTYMHGNARSGMSSSDRYRSFASAFESSVLEVKDMMQYSESKAMQS